MATPETLEQFKPGEVLTPINGDPAGKHFLSLDQLTEADIRHYLEEAQCADRVVAHPDMGGIALLPFRSLTALMRQESTRTMGSMGDAMIKLGGGIKLIGGMRDSSEAKGESVADSVLAIATQSDVLGTRTKEEFGPHYAAFVINTYHEAGKLTRFVPVINLGDGTNEHPTQTIGDLYTIQKHLLIPSGKDGEFEGLSIAIVGDHQRYRAFHSMMKAAKILGMKVIAVESEASPVPEEYKDLMGDNLQTTSDLDSAMQSCDILYPGRQPDEYDGEDYNERERSRVLSHSYEGWRIDLDRLQQMPPGAIYMHARPRRASEVCPGIDFDPRVVDVDQMALMIPARMAIIAGAMGRSIVEKSNFVLSQR